jgi:hydrogenase maturation protein HypF
MEAETNTVIFSQQGSRIIVGGIVQGVGFRPFVYTLALNNSLTGWVRNTSAGVEITIFGSPEAQQNFTSVLSNHPTPLSRIDFLEVTSCPYEEHQEFQIILSQPTSGGFQPVSADMAICDDCSRELFAPSDRRYRYPFINCTNCGPRFTIITDIPYDRPKTTMASFSLCQDCRQEYNNPLDRRFHAQPVACPACGPQISFYANGEMKAAGDEALQMTRERLRNGQVIAIKGLGGYHLACDALNIKAIRTLRERKKRSDKAFALMAWSLEVIQKYAVTTPAAEQIITSRQKPVVILPKRPDCAIPGEIAPGQHTIGFMLPYTPLHLLLMEPEVGFPDVLVMTSANLSEEPIAFTDADAFQRLSDVADGFLIHDRQIHMRMDDSVIRVYDEHSYPIRRARGYAPDPIRLTTSMPSILAVGAGLKNTFCMTRDQYAFISHHIGDMVNYETYHSFEQAVEYYQRLFRITPEIIACDLHPDILPTRYARQLAESHGLPIFQIQHHHSHLAACLADNQYKLDEAVIGLTFDGTGLGTDNTIWGGEVLVGGYQAYQRRFHLEYFPMPGGDQAVQTPARLALGILHQFGMEWDAQLPPVRAICETDRTALLSIIHHKINTPLTSSMGRLFDAVASLIGVRQHVTYEGQAAIELEACIDPTEEGLYPFQINADIIGLEHLWNAILQDWYKGLSATIISARFHNTIARLCLEACQTIRKEQCIPAVALSGGVWQNLSLLEKTLHLLREDGFQVFTHRQIPTNDGGISLGQALIAGSQAG